MTDPPLPFLVSLLVVAGAPFPELVFVLVLVLGMLLSDVVVEEEIDFAWRLCRDVPLFFLWGC